MNRLFAQKLIRYVVRKLDVLYGSLFHDLETVKTAMMLRPYEIHIELTNICNADCVFCPYQFQERPKTVMSDAVFQKIVDDYVAIGGGSVCLTPIVGDALIDPQFLKRVAILRSTPAIDRIFVTTNAILLDRFGIDKILDSGLSSVTISTSGFDRGDYERIYRSSAYERMRANVTELVSKNAAREKPLNISIALRNDRPLEEVLKDTDFQPILRYRPHIDFTWAFTTAGGRITRPGLPPGFRLRVLKEKTELCGHLLNGCMILPDGSVQACSCVASMDAGEDLRIGNIMEQSLGELFTGARMSELREQFNSGALNKTCANCDMYQIGLDKFRTREGRKRADINRRRASGKVVHREDKPTGAFAGG